MNVSQVLSRLLLLLLIPRLGGSAEVATNLFAIGKTPDAVWVKNPEGKEILRYQLTVPSGVALPIQCACYFHPLTTPAGVVLTEVAPADHRHHRGIFLAWVEMHGEKDADFWGWGEHAPVKDRKIVNRSVDNLTATAHGIAFSAHNDWIAEDQVVVRETLRINLRPVGLGQGNKDGAARSASGAATGYLLDLRYHLNPQMELQLAQWAFSGFCVRTRKEGGLEAYGPDGLVNLPDPSHTKPESDWPAAPWYAYSLELPQDKLASIAVLGSPKNPPALWHNHRKIRLLNPCIVAPRSVTLLADQPLVLHYRVLASDGKTPVELLNRLAGEWPGDRPWQC